MLTLDDIKRRLRDVAELFYPHLCPVCGSKVEGYHQKVCTRCMVDAPLTGFEQLADNPVSRRVWNLIPAQRACALLYYVAVLHNENKVCLSYGGQTVSNNKTCSPPHHIKESLLYSHFCHCVNG